MGESDGMIVERAAVGRVDLYDGVNDALGILDPVFLIRRTSFAPCRRTRGTFLEGGFRQQRDKLERLCRYISRPGVTN